MQLTNKEQELIAADRIRAIIRQQNIDEQVGDFLFEVNGKVYKLKEKKRWTVARIAAQRSNIDFRCDTVTAFKNLITYLYEDYWNIQSKIVWLVIFKPDKQKSLGDEEWI